MMYLTKEQLSAIETFAERLYPPSLIAIAIGVDADDLADELDKSGSAAFSAFYKGYLTQFDMIRQETIKAAKNGSNPAMVELCGFIKNIQKELKYG